MHLDSWLDYLSIVARATGFVYIFAAVSKLGSPRSFILTIRALTPLPARGVQLIAGAVPATEIVVGVLFLVGALSKYVAWVSVSLLMVFSLVALVAVIRGDEIPCSCFGQSSEETFSSRTIARNLVLTFLTMPLILRNTPTPFSLDLTLATGRDLGEITFLTVLTLVAIGISTLISAARRTLAQQ
ncbi:MAG: MauE/DoxX family redox-associated membrane protein [Anaerolineales bacterium]